MSKVKIGDVSVDVEVAKSREDRYEGLSKREELGEKEGMLFVWPEKKLQSLIMRSMSFPIDVIWIEDGAVKDTDTLRMDGERSYRKAKYAIEVSAGFCDRENIEAGDPVLLPESMEKSRPIEKPFAGYEDFSECVSDHSDKDDPEAYCSQIHYEATGEWPAEKSTPEGVPEDADYLEPDEDPPEGMTTVEGPQGGRYAVEEDTEEEDDVDGVEPADSEADDIGATVVPGEARRRIDDEEDAMTALDEFEQIEEEHPFNSWEGSDAENLTEGSFVRVQDEMFQMEGESAGENEDGQLGVIVEDSDPPVVMTEDGERREVDLDAWELPDDDDTARLLATWDDPANRVATGESNWEDFGEEYVPDNVEIDEEEPKPEDDVPDWTEEEVDPSRYAESRAPEEGIDEEDLYIRGDEVVEFEQVEHEGDIDVFEEPDSEHNVQQSVIDGVHNRVQAPTHIKQGETNYIDFSEESDLSDGWYEVKDGMEQLDPDDPNSVAFVLYNEEEGEVEVEASDLLDEAHAAHTPVEATAGDFTVEAAPEPSGEPDPETWSVDWNAQDEEKTGDALPMAQKKLLMREWEAAVDDEAADSVAETIRNVKDSTFNTDGQKYDKLIQAVMDADGEPRSNGFEDAEEPTEAEIEAMELMQQASQKFFEERFGEETEIHRALADYSHENILPKLGDAIRGESDVSGKQLELEDNPAGVWSSEESAARTFTMVGGTSKSLRIENDIGAEDVFNMPDAIFPYEEREEVVGEDSDWDEAEINTPSHGVELSSDDVTVVNAQEVKDDGTVHEASLTDVLENPATVVQDGNAGSVARFLKTLNDLGDEELYESYANRLRENDAVQEHEDWDMIEEAMESIEYDPDESLLFDAEKQEDTITIDLRGEEDSNWLHTHGEINESGTSETKEKLLRDVISTVRKQMKDEGSWVPYEGPQGGSGWRHSETDEVVYDDDPPGDSVADVSDPDELEDALNSLDEGAFGDVEFGSDLYEQEDGYEVHIRHLRVPPEKRGQGIASDTIDSVVDMASMSDVPVNEVAINLGGGEDSAAFLESIGFEDVTIHEQAGEELASGVLPIESEEGGDESDTTERREKSFRNTLRRIRKRMSGNSERYTPSEGDWVRWQVDERRGNVVHVDDERNVAMVEVYEDGESTGHTNTAGFEDIVPDDTPDPEGPDVIETSKADSDPEEEIEFDKDSPAFVHREDGRVDMFQKQEGDGGWVPYEGPQGGTGWENTDTGEVVYTDDPPGPKADWVEEGRVLEGVTGLDEIEPGDEVAVGDDFYEVQSVDEGPAGQMFARIEHDGEEYTVNEGLLEAKVLGEALETGDYSVDRDSYGAELAQGLVQGGLTKSGHENFQNVRQLQHNLSEVENPDLLLDVLHEEASTRNSKTAVSRIKGRLSALDVPESEIRDAMPGGGDTVDLDELDPVDPDVVAEGQSVYIDPESFPQLDEPVEGEVEEVMHGQTWSDALYILPEEEPEGYVREHQVYEIDGDEYKVDRVLTDDDGNIKAQSFMHSESGAIMTEGELPENFEEEMELVEDTSRDVIRVEFDRMEEDLRYKQGERPDDSYPGVGYANAVEEAEEIDIYEGFREKRGIEDRDAIERISKHATDDQLKELMDRADDQDDLDILPNIGRMAGAMLYKRGEGDIEDAVEVNDHGSATTSREEVIQSTEMTFEKLDTTTAAALAAHTSKVDLESYSALGCYRSISKQIVIDEISSWSTTEDTVAHEFGHSLHYLLGFSDDTSRDNTEKSSIQNYVFDVNRNEPLSDDVAREFIDEFEEWVEGYEHRVQQGYAKKIANQLRDYQNTNGNEVFAVAFGTWVDNPSELEDTQPELKELFDEYFGSGNGDEE